MEQDPVRRKRLRQRPFAMLCIGSPLVLCLGWTALWLFARREAAHAMDGWIAVEAGRGRQWACPDRRIDGFPFELRVSCSHPSFHGQVGGEMLDVAAAGLMGSVYLHQPNAVAASVASPLTVVGAGEDAPSTLSWSALKVEARLLPDAPARVEVQVDDPLLDNRGVTNTADRVEVHVTPVAGSGMRDPDYDVAFKLEAGRLPALDASLQNADPLAIDVTGRLTRTVPATGEPWQVLVERWRQAGGFCDISSLDMSKGDIKATLRGSLNIDEAHRVAGQLQTQVSGALLAHVLDDRLGHGSTSFGMSLFLNTALSRSLSGQSMIDLPVSLVDGRVSVGPFPTAQRLLPLY